MEKYVKVFLELSKFRSNYSARSRIGGTSSRSWRMFVRSSHPSPPPLETSLHTLMTSSSQSTRTSLRLSSDVQTRLGGMILYSAKLKLSRWGGGRSFTALTISQDNEICWLLDEVINTYLWSDRPELLWGVIELLQEELKQKARVKDISLKWILMRNFLEN